MRNRAFFHGISLIVTSFNRPSRLATAVETAHENSGCPIEIIVVDDGSRDVVVRRTIEELQLNDTISSAIFLNPPGHNTGRGRAINAGMSISSGSVIGFADQDVEFLPNWGRTVMDILFPAGSPPIGFLSLYETYMPGCDANETRIETIMEYPVKVDSHSYVMGSTGFASRKSWLDFGPLDEYQPSFGEDHKRMLEVTNSDSYVCATPVVPLAKNDGYGIGPNRSTLVRADGSVQPIHMEPRIFNA